MPLDQQIKTLTFCYKNQFRQNSVSITRYKCKVNEKQKTKNISVKQKKKKKSTCTGEIKDTKQ